jgi:hypothetical protein
MKYLITIPHAKAHKAPKLIEYICDFFEIKENFKGLDAWITIETKSELLYLKHSPESMNYRLTPGVRQLINSIDINTLAD